MQCKRCGAPMIPVLAGDGIKTSMRCSDDGCYWATRDRCVICGVPTEYDVEDNVELRQCYHRGVGQLCGKCELNIS